MEIVISKVGTPCYSSLIDETIGNCALSRTVLGIRNIRSDLIDPYYLLAFLRSEIGFQQLYREREQQIQLQLTLDRVRNIKVIIPEFSEQKKIKELLIGYKENLEKAKTLFKSAKDLIESKFHMDETKNTYKTTLGSIISSDRMDPEFFNPKFGSLINQIKTSTNSFKTIGELFEIQKGVEVGSEQYTDKGPIFLRVSNLDEIELNKGEVKRIPIDLYQTLSTKYKPNKGEFLISKDASTGIIHLLREDIDMIISSGIVRCTLKTEHTLDIDYLITALNSKVIKLQSERNENGSVIRHLPLSQLKQTAVPILHPSEQKEIGDLVRQSYFHRNLAHGKYKEALSSINELVFFK